MKNPFLHFAVSALFMGTLIFLGCNEDPMVDDPTIEDPIDTIPDTVYILLLEQPVDVVQPSYCCTELSWYSDALGASRLQLAKDTSFYEVILDTLIDTHNFSYQEPLAPNATYYWSVKIDTLSATAVFSTEDLISDFAGVHEIELHRSSWFKGSPNGGSDTTYITMIEVSTEDSAFYINVNNSSIYGNYCFDRYNTINELRYIACGASYESYFRIDLQTDSIFGEGGWYHPGGSISWDFHGKAE